MTTVNTTASKNNLWQRTKNAAKSLKPLKRANNILKTATLRSKEQLAITSLKTSANKLNDTATMLKELAESEKNDIISILGLSDNATIITQLTKENNIYGVDVGGDNNVRKKFRQELANLNDPTANLGADKLNTKKQQFLDKNKELIDRLVNDANDIFVDKSQAQEKRQLNYDYNGHELTMTALEQAGFVKEKTKGAFPKQYEVLKTVDSNNTSQSRGIGGNDVVNAVATEKGEVTGGGAETTTKTEEKQSTASKTTKETGSTGGEGSLEEILKKQIGMLKPAGIKKQKEQFKVNNSEFIKILSDKKDEIKNKGDYLKQFEDNNSKNTDNNQPRNITDKQTTGSVQSQSENDEAIKILQQRLDALKPSSSKTSIDAASLQERLKNLNNQNGKEATAGEGAVEKGELQAVAGSTATTTPSAVAEKTKPSGFLKTFINAASAFSTFFSPKVNKKEATTDTSDTKSVSSNASISVTTSNGDSLDDFFSAKSNQSRTDDDDISTISSLSGSISSTSIDSSVTTYKIKNEKIADDVSLKSGQVEV